MKKKQGNPFITRPFIGVPVFQADFGVEI